MREWTKRLDKKKVLIADGAWGTELANRGLAPGEPPERWNLERPDEVSAVARAYVEAGADIILTNTFGANPMKLAKVNLLGKTTQVNRSAVEISVEAAAGRALVFASIGPTGEFMEPLGSKSADEMTSCFAEQVRAIAEGSPDGIVIETMTDLAEAQAALRAVRDNSNLPVVVSMTYEKGLKGYATMMGVKPGQAVEQLASAGADIVGANCGSGIEDMVEVTRIMRAATGLALWVKPNAGLPELVDGRTVFRQSPEAMAERLGGLVEAGANIIGGCCGTTPRHIELLVERARRLVQERPKE